MKFIRTRCPLCLSLEDYEVLYPKNFEEADLSADVYSARKIPDRIHYQIVRCHRDGMVRSNPVPEESFINELYKQSKFTYEHETEHLVTTYLAALEPVLRQLPKAARILEVGCGNGFLLKALCEKGYGNVCGVEPSIEAAAKSDPLVRDKITVDVLGPATFKSGTFDLICFFQVLEHMRDPNDFLKICHDLLVPGGFVVAFNHDVESLQARILRERSPIIDIGHYSLFSKVTMEKIFMRNHFQTVKTDSPLNVVSLRHMIWLVPFLNRIKAKFLGAHGGVLGSLLNLRLRVRLGNLRLIAVKK